MRRISLNEFANEKGQVQAAALLGMSQGALSKALRVGRTVFVTEHEDGTFSAQELRAFPSQKEGPADIDQAADEPLAHRAPAIPFTDRRLPRTELDKPRAGQRATDLTVEQAADLAKAEHLAEHLHELAPGKRVGG